MRNMGLLCLEEVDTLPLNCGDSTICEDRSRWESTMDGIQDRMEITLNEGKRPAGDTPYRDPLLKVRYARYMYTLAFSNKDASWACPSSCSGTLRSRPN
jgi:hypothetical protein